MSAANENDASAQGLSIYDEMDPMLKLAELIYAYIDARQVAKVYLEQFRKKYNLTDKDLEVLNNSFKNDSKEDLKRLFDAKTQNKITDSEVTLVQDKFSLLSLPKNSADIEKDLKKTKEYSKQISDHNIGSIESINKGFGDAQSLIVHTIDDDFSGTEDEYDDECTWAITINHLKKRIAVVFRGSTVKGDWRADFSLNFTDMKLHGPKSTDPVIGKVHQGFHHYLYGDTKLGSDQRTICKAETILGELQALFIKHNDYKLYVTGHSLGAALSTLFSFRAAYDSGIPNKPVMNISYASPYVGNWEFRKHFQELEKEGKIRHIRVSNEDDVVPLAPNVGLHWGFPVLYKHVGLNIKLYSNQGYFRKSLLQISFPKPDSYVSGIYRAWDNNILGGITLTSASNHSCVEYRKRLEAAKTELCKIPSIEALYQDENITGGLFTS